MTLASAKTADFECAKPGENSFALAKGGRPMPHQCDMTINGQRDLSKIVRGKSGACVYGVTLTNGSGIYDYQMLVDAQGPKGIGSGSLHLVFEDETRDGYNLAITSSKRKRHTVNFNSKKPGIVRFDWKN